MTLEEPRHRTRRFTESNRAGNCLVAIPLGVAFAFAIYTVATTDLVGWPSPVETGVGALILLFAAFYFREQRSLAREKMWRRTRLPLLLRWRFGDRREATTCGYCRDALDAEPDCCPDCGATYHAACLDELGGCATLGCAHAAAPGPRDDLPPRKA